MERRERENGAGDMCNYQDQNLLYNYVYIYEHIYIYIHIGTIRSTTAYLLHEVWYWTLGPPESD